MKYKKIMFMLVLAVFLLSITCVSASEIDDTLASEDTNTIGLSVDNDIIEDNLQTSEENDELASTDYDEAITQTDTEVLGADSATYSDLAEEIRHSGNITLTHKNYTYDEGETIEISEANKVIDGNGAVIDMDGSTIRAFYISASGVTIKNLTIINANYYISNGGAIYFSSSATSGTVSNCNFTNNAAFGDGGAVYFEDQGTVTNCIFAGNTVNYGGGAVYFSSTGTVTNCIFAGNTVNYGGGAVYFNRDGNVTNCNFVNNSATDGVSLGGAIMMDSGTVSNCNFTDNTATYGGAVRIIAGAVTNCNFVNNTASEEGGAIYFSNSATSGAVSNCNFADNTATYYGGAVYFNRNGKVTNCNFTGNNATNGSAIYFYRTSATKTVSNSRFLNNRANAEALDVVKNDNNITITFTGHNNLLNAIYSSEDAEVAFTNVKYWGANGITTVSARLSGSNKAAGQNITVGVVVNNELVLSDVMVTNESGMIVLDISAGENYYISARHDADSYYTEAEKTISNNTKFNANVISQTTTNKTVNITAKSNIYSEAMPGKLLFMVPTGENITANYVGNGTWWAVYEFADYGDYQVNATYVGLDNVTINNGTISISKISTEIIINTASLDLFVGDEIVIVANLTPADAGNVTFTSSNESVVEVDVQGNVIAQGKGQAIITVSFAGNNKYAAAENKTINVTVSLDDASVTVDNNTLNLKAGETYAINATKHPDTIMLDIAYTSSNSSVVTVDKKGIVTAVGVGTAVITVEVGDDEIYAKNSTNVTVTVSKVPTEIGAKPVTATYNVNRNLVITLKDANGNPVTGVSLSVDLNGAKKYTTDKNGQVKVSTKGLDPKTYTAKITFNGNAKYAKSAKNVKVTVKKAKPKIIAKKKNTYRAKAKTKKLKITLKDNTGKPIKNAKVRLMLKKIGKGSKKKTKSKANKKIAKTNKKGKATFKVKKNKKAKYLAYVKFYANKHYMKTVKKIKITIK